MYDGMVDNGPNRANAEPFVACCRGC